MPMLPNLLPMLLILLVCLDDPAPKPAPGPAAPPMVEMKIRVVDADKKPLAKATVSVSTESKAGPGRVRGVTATDGTFVVSVPKDSTSIACYVSCGGFATVSRHWDAKALETSIPTDFTFPLKRAVSIGGRIIDSQGKPIAGVHIGVQCDDLLQDLPDGIVYHEYLASDEGDLKTDENGVWWLQGVPPGIEKISLKFVHPDYVSDDYRGGIQKAQSITVAQLKRREALVRMESGAVVTGTVRDAAGKPIAGAAVVFHESPFMFPNKAVATDAKGRYRIPALPAGKHPVAVAAPNSCPTYREIVVTAGGYVEDFRLAPGNTLKVKVVGETGKPVSASFSPCEWKGTQMLYSGAGANLPTMGIPPASDADGIYAWSGAPSEPVTFGIRAEGMRTRMVKLTAGPFEQTLVLEPNAEFAGRVTDAKTGKAVETFRAFPIAEFNPSLSAVTPNESEIVTGRGGAFRITFPEQDHDYRLLIEAEGYRSQLSRPSLFANKVRRADFALEPAAPVSGRVVGSDGKPLAGVRVSLANRYRSTSIADRSQSGTVPTDSEGRFRFPAQPEPFVLLFRHDSGFLIRECKTLDADVGILKLGAWAIVRGTLRSNGEPVPGHSVWLHPIYAEGPYGRILALHRVATTDENGRYEVLQAVPGPSRVSVFPEREGPPGVPNGEVIPFVSVAGRPVVVDFGKGTRVGGRVRPPAEPSAPRTVVHLVRKTPDVSPAADSGIDPFDFSKEPPLGALHAARSNRRFSAEVDGGGRFWISGVPAGDYWVAAETFRVEHRHPTTLGARCASLTVTPAQAAGESVTVADLDLPHLLPVAVGESLPTIGLKGLDGKPIALADFEGKYLVVHVWAGWAAKIESEAVAVAKLRADLPADKVAFLGANLDSDPVKARERAKAFGFDWPHVDFGSTPRDADKWQLFAPRTTMVLDPEGKLAFVGWQPHEVEAFLRGKLGK